MALVTDSLKPFGGLFVKRLLPFPLGLFTIPCLSFILAFGSHLRGALGITRRRLGPLVSALGVLHMGDCYPGARLTRTPPIGEADHASS